MMKCEFEERIGKEVTEETFQLYNKMYLATDVDKDTFVSMLNIEAIPEDPESAERRIAREKRVATLKNAIKNCRALRDKAEEDMKEALQEGNSFLYEHHKWLYNNYDNQIRQLKFML